VLTVAASSSSPPVAPTAESSEEDPAGTRSVDLAEESEMSEISADQSSLIGDAATDSLLPHVPQSDFFSLMEQPTEYEDALRQAYRARGDKLPVLTAAAAAAAVTQQEDEEPFEL
jgi:hypothetical protein